jgi:hypothetical protein
MAGEEYVFDLDVLRAQRAEARKGPRRFRLGGKSWTLPDELPLALGIKVMSGDTWGSLVDLLGDQWDEFYELTKPTLDDALALVERLAPAYGFADPGELLASPGSSSTNGTRSRPTSNGSTRSTSRKPSSAKAPRKSPSAG